MKYMYIPSALIIAIGFFGVMSSRNFRKRLVMINVIASGVMIFIAVAGYIPSGSWASEELQRCRFVLPTAQVLLIVMSLALCVINSIAVTLARNLQDVCVGGIDEDAEGDSCIAEFDLSDK